jgi:hypothetical protein
MRSLLSRFPASNTRLAAESIKCKPSSPRSSAETGRLIRSQT